LSGSALALLLATMCVGSAAQAGSRSVEKKEPLRGPRSPAAQWDYDDEDLWSSPLALAQVPAASTALAVPLQAGASLDARVLVLSADGSEPDLGTIRQALEYQGTPYTLWIAKQHPGGLVPSVLANGLHGNFQAVVLTSASLGYFNGTSYVSALAPAEWRALWDYEAAFSVRQVNWYAYPTPDLGFSSGTAARDTTAAPLALSLTSAGSEVFPYLVSIPNVRSAYAYLAAADATATPLLVDGAGNALAVLKKWPDGREALTMTFDSAPWLVHAVAVSSGVLSWATRGVFVGARRVFIGAQIDDLFIEDDLYLGGTYRMTGDDFAAADLWQQAWQAMPATAGLRLSWAFNGEGTDGSYLDDDLTPTATSLQQDFDWISHTYTHLNLDAADSATTTRELSLNAEVARRLGLAAFTNQNLVQPDVSGLYNQVAMQAAWAFGTRYIVSDTSKTGQASPAPNTGIYNALVPGLLELGRYPTNLFYNVSTPEEWVAEYNAFYAKFWGRQLTYDEVLEKESDVLLGYLLKGDMNPVMFHQSNARLYDGVHSLLSDLLDRTFAKYTAIYRLPILSPPMDELGRMFAERMQAGKAGVTATLLWGNQIRLQAQRAATVWVTGLCTPTAKVYGGQCIASVPLAAGQTQVFSLATARAGIGLAAVHAAWGPGAADGSSDRRRQSGRLRYRGGDRRGDRKQTYRD
jgi:hypothetical protein